MDEVPLPATMPLQKQWLQNYSEALEILTPVMKVDAKHGIARIKEIRETTGLNLKSAKWVYDRLNFPEIRSDEDVAAEEEIEREVIVLDKGRPLPKGRRRVREFDEQPSPLRRLFIQCKDERDEARAELKNQNASHMEEVSALKRELEFNRSTSERRAEKLGEKYQKMDLAKLYLFGSQKIASGLRGNEKEALSKILELALQALS